MEKDVAISVKNVSKTFRIPHEKVTSVRGAVINAFKSGGYEEFQALDDVSFEVEKGEFFGIIGRNGSGKSTLLKILAGIYQADKGKIEIDGMISPFLELGIGFNPELSGRDNVYLNATVLGMSKKQIDKKFDSIVAFSELERFIDQKLKNYSSGMQVRLAFSVSIHANREILLMDEVLAVGDTNFQKKCMDTFKDYRKRNKTVILVTHDIGAVRNYCSRAFLLHNGRIEKMGDVDEVCDEYILKNISSDARKELQKKQEIKKSEAGREEELKAELKNKKQTIVDVKAYNANKKELIVITRGDDFFVDVTVDLKEIVNELNLAVQIFDKNTNNFVSGNNTQIDGFECGWKIGKNKIRLKFEDNNLNYGEIYIKAVLFQYKKDGNLILDELSSADNNVFFSVQRKDSGGGIMYIKHDWEKIDEKK